MFHVLVVLPIRLLLNTAVDRAALLLQRMRCIPIPALFIRISRAASDTFSLLLQKLNANSAAGGDSMRSWALLRAVPRFLKLCAPLALCFLALCYLPLVHVVLNSIAKEGVSATTPARAAACIAALLIVLRMAGCLLFWHVEHGSFKIAIQAGQCVMIRFDTRGKKLDVDAFLSQFEDDQEPRFTSSAGTTASAATVLAVSLVALYRRSRGRSLVLVFAAGSIIFLAALLGERINECAVTAGERDVAVYNDDVQRQYEAPTPLHIKRVLVMFCLQVHTSQLLRR